MEFLEFNIDSAIYSSVICVLLLIAAVISGGESALHSLTKAQRDELEDSTSGVDRAILMLEEDSDRLPYAILIASNLASIAIILLSNALINSTILFSTIAAEVAFKVIVIAVALLIFTVFIPKSLSTYRTMGFVRFSAPLLLALRWSLWPLTFLLMKVGGRLAIPSLQQPSNVSVEQLQSALDVTGEDGDEDKKLLSGIVGFIGREVSSIMRPRVDVVAIESSSDFDSVISTIKECNHSRIPVYSESFDEIEGVLFVKDLLPYIAEGVDFEWRRLLRKAYIVPESKKINDLLEDFQAKRQHLAIVVDEYGGTLGIVTLEDILEEIVGEISDETDSSAKFYKELSPGTYLFDGSTHLMDFAEVLSIDEDIVEEYSGNADTLAGLLMELKGEFFKEGESVKFLNFTLIASEIERYRITKVLITTDDTDI